MLEKVQSRPGLTQEADETDTQGSCSSFLPPRVSDWASFQHWKSAPDCQAPLPRVPLPPVEGSNASLGGHMVRAVKEVGPLCHYHISVPLPPT